jgi:nucleoside-diphosphate-sugar epimerase
MFPTYSLSKIAAESVVRFAARELGLPATIARLSVPYGNNGGWPWFHVQMMKAGMPIDVHPDRPNTYNPIHQDDIMAKIPYLLAAATSETCTLNFGGEPVSIEDWCAYLGELTGLSPVFRDNPKAFGSLQIDPAAMQAAIGTTQVDWKAGMKRMLEQLAPDLLKC